MRVQVCKGTFLLFLAFAIAGPAWGQVAGTATVTGTVTDPTGAVLPSAGVTATHEATGVTRTTTTDATGKYVIPQLPPGTYKIEVKISGFKAAVRQKVELLVGTATTVDVQLEVGDVTQEVVVEAGVVGLNTTDASLGNPFSGTEVAQLPSLDLNPAALLSLQAGVTYVPVNPDTPGGYGGTSDFDGRGGSVNGARSDQTNVTLDGVDVNDPQKGFAFTSVLRATQASLAEFRTTTTNYSSDAGGRSSAAQVQLLTKSGTNNVHGQVYWAHRNEAINANDFFLNSAGQKESKFRRHLYGAALGGPVVKDRFFLFGNWERMEESLFKAALRDVPSESLRDGVFIYQCQDLAGFAACPAAATTVTGVSGQSYAVPAGFFGLSPAELLALDPLGLGVNMGILNHFAGYPLPNAVGNFDNINISGFRFAAPADNTFNTYILRADLHIDRAAKHTVFWRGTLQDDSLSTEPQFSGQNPLQTVLNASKGFALGYTALLTPDVTNSFRWGLTRIKEQTAGIRNSEFVDFRFIDSLIGFESAGLLNRSFGRTTPTHHTRDDVSWTRARHTFTFGGEVRWTRNTKFSNANSFHTFLINPSWLPDGGRSAQPGQPECSRPGCTAVPAVHDDFGSAFRDAIVQIYGSISQVDAFYNFDRTGATLAAGEAVRRKFAVDEYEFYLQDQWRATPTFTITAGVRYFLASPPWEQNGNQVVPTPALSDWFDCRQETMLAGRPTSDCGLITIDLGGPANNGANYYHWDTNNWSPRLSLAWAPRYKQGLLGALAGDGKLVLRAGYSLVYDRIGNGLATTFDEVGSFGLSTDITSFFGGCGIGTVVISATDIRPPCERFTGIFDTSAAAAQSLQPSPGGTFPTVPPEGLLTVISGIDDRVKTPYAHTYNFSVGRELPWNLTFEAAYVGRSGHFLPLIRDYAMPADLVDPTSGISAFEAARELIGLAAQGVVTSDPRLAAGLPFWENFFPSFGPAGINGGCLPIDIFDVSPDAPGADGIFGTDDDIADPTCGFSATQVAFDYMLFYHGTPAGGSGFGTSTFWQDVDYFGFPGFLSCPGGSDIPQIDSDNDGVADTGDNIPDCPNAFFPAQYVNLHTWTTVAQSQYHGLQLMFRKRMSNGLLFSINYTLSKSLDHSSTPERQEIIGGFFTGGYTGTTINAWKLNQEYSFSDFDMRHQLNAHWIFDLPFGRGRTLLSGLPGWANQIISAWQLSGIVRWNSGLPANVINGRTWPTNWDLQGNATCAPAGAHPFGLDQGPCPRTRTVKDTADGRGPNLFADPDAALRQFRFTDTGRRGQRNILRADNYFNLDFGIGKSFHLPWEGHSLQFRWDIFNLTNSVYFDAVSLNLDIETRSTFGNYTSVMGGPRRMQVALRYEF